MASAPAWGAFVHSDARPLLFMLDRHEEALARALAGMLAGWELNLDVPDQAEAKATALIGSFMVRVGDQAVAIQDRQWGRLERKDVQTFRDERVAWARKHGAALAVNLTDQMRTRIRRIIEAGAAAGIAPDQLRRQIAGIVPALPGLSARTRAELIARTELHNAATWAQEREALGLVARGGELVKVWTATMDHRTRRAHRQANGQTRQINQDFAVGGARMSRPGDPRGGVRNVVRCFPADVTVQGSARALTRRRFEGDLIEIVTAAGDKLAGTPNHPILTDRGWVALNLLQEGDNVVCACGKIEPPAGADPDIEDVDAPLGQVFDALARRLEMKRVARVDVDFHGERPDHDVDIVLADRGLPDSRALPAPQLRDQIKLVSPDEVLGALLGMSRAGHGLATVAGFDPYASKARDDNASLYLEGLSQRLDAFPFEEPGAYLLAEREVAAPDQDSAALAGGSPDPVARRKGMNSRRWDAGQLANLLGCQPGQIELQQVVAVRKRKSLGHVYNLEDAKGWYVANRIVAHNCRCVARYIPRSYVAEDRQRRAADMIRVARRADNFAAAIRALTEDMDPALRRVVLAAARADAAWNASEAALAAAIEAQARAAQDPGN